MMERTKQKKDSRRWPVALGASLCLAALVGLGLHSVRDLRAADDQEDAIRKALDNLKNGAPPVKEDKPSDLNPVDQMRRDQAALEALRKKLAENPSDEQAKKEVEELQKKLADAMKNNRLAPQFPAFPVPLQPINPADLDKDIAEMMRQQRLLMEQQMRQLQQNRMGGLRLNLMARRPGEFRPGDGRLGVRIERPSPTLVDQLNLPDDQGIVVLEVYPETPAAKAGLRANDILLEVAGKPVANEVIALQLMIRDIKPDEKVDMVVLRKGKKETIKEVTLPMPKPEAEVPNIENFPMVPNIRFGLQPGALGEGVRASSVSISVNNGEFTIKAVEDGVKYTVIGAKDDGGFQPATIEIDDNGTVHKADKLDKVNEQYRPTIERLLKRIR
jgi:hypothetical protein